jgi:3'(2'), 5'-bisphosphate nucleotidase
MCNILGVINIEQLKRLAIEAGNRILEVYSTDFNIVYKGDKSPLTEADQKSNEVICHELQKHYPEIPILSEENRQIAYEERKKWKSYWCIDPLDGTKEFVKRNGEFTVNIALIEDNKPILGIVYAPVIKKLYHAIKGQGAFLNDKKLPLTKNRNFSVVASKSHNNAETEAFIAALRVNFGEIEVVSRGSSLKLCMVAEGSASIYPRLALTMEWDTAAAHAVVLEAGKHVLQYRAEVEPEDYFSAENKMLEPLTYNKPNLLNPFFVVA